MIGNFQQSGLEFQSFGPLEKGADGSHQREDAYNHLKMLYNIKFD